MALSHNSLPRLLPALLLLLLAWLYLALDLSTITSSLSSTLSRRLPGVLGSRFQHTNMSSIVSPAVSAASISPSPNLNFKVRPAADRGHGDHGWLNSFHTFSFADYYDADYQGVGPLRVINEDRVSGGNGFGKHSHRDFEIFSYVLAGNLQHNDSMGNEEVLHRGDVQFTSAGKGIQHSEYNADKKELVHFIQMWVKPNARGLTPNYQTRHWDDNQKEGKLRLLISPTGEDNTISINNDVKVYASILDNQQSITYTIPPQRQAYLHLTMDVTGMHSEVRSSGLVVTSSHNSAVTANVRDGDGLLITLQNSALGDEITITGNNQGKKRAELILFDLPLQ